MCVACSGGQTLMMTLVMLAGMKTVSSRKRGGSASLKGPAAAALGAALFTLASVLHSQQVA
jgi:hypothetical protein